MLALALVGGVAVVVAPGMFVEFSSSAGRVAAGESTNSFRKAWST